MLLRAKRVSETRNPRGDCSGRQKHPPHNNPSSYRAEYTVYHSCCDAVAYGTPETQSDASHIEKEGAWFTFFSTLFCGRRCMLSAAHVNTAAQEADITIATTNQNPSAKPTMIQAPHCQY
jgi:hypothetical protein